MTLSTRALIPDCQCSAVDDKMLEKLKHRMELRLYLPKKKVEVYSLVYLALFTRLGTISPWSQDLFIHKPFQLQLPL